MSQYPIELIVAATPDGEIGYANTIPWHLKGDLKRFRETTMGHVVIMGRKTYESLPGTLKGRTIVVVSETLLKENKGRRHPGPGFMSFVDSIQCKVLFAMSLMDALAVAMAEVILMPECKIFVAGGARLYEEALEMMDDNPNMRLTVHLTTVYKDPITEAYDTVIKNFDRLDRYDLVGDPIVVYDEEWKDPPAQHLDPGGWYWPDPLPRQLISRTLSHTYSTLVRK